MRRWSGSCPLWTGSAIHFEDRDNFTAFLGRQSVVMFRQPFVQAHPAEVGSRFINAISAASTLACRASIPIYHVIRCSHGAFPSLRCWCSHGRVNLRGSLGRVGWHPGNSDPTVQPRWGRRTWLAEKQFGDRSGFSLGARFTRPPACSGRSIIHHRIRAASSAAEFASIRSC